MMAFQVISIPIADTDPVFVRYRMDTKTLNAAHPYDTNLRTHLKCAQLLVFFLLAFPSCSPTVPGSAAE